MNQCHDCKGEGFTLWLVLTDSLGKFKVCRECWVKRQNQDE